jgi:hypothetical protein
VYACIAVYVCAHTWMFKTAFGYKLSKFIMIECCHHFRHSQIQCYRPWDPNLMHVRHTSTVSSAHILSTLLAYTVALWGIVQHRRMRYCCYYTVMVIVYVY